MGLMIMFAVGVLTGLPIGIAVSVTIDIFSAKLATKFVVWIAKKFFNEDLPRDWKKW